MNTPHASTVADHMKTDLVTLTADLEIVRAVALLMKNEVSGACVLDENGARHAPRHHYNFPGDCCISVNDEAASKAAIISLFSRIGLFLPIRILFPRPSADGPLRRQSANARCSN